MSAERVREIKQIEVLLKGLLREHETFKFARFKPIFESYSAHWPELKPAHLRELPSPQDIELMINFVHSLDENDLAGSLKELRPEDIALITRALQRVQHLNREFMMTEIAVIEE